jgi:hypothetical protein
MLASDVADAKKNKKSTWEKARTVIIAGFTAAAICAVIFMFYYGEKDPEVEFSDNQLGIRAMYGLAVRYSEITNVTLLPQNMNELGSGSRTNGYAGFGESLRGHFTYKDLGAVLLFVQKNTAPTIHIARDGKADIYINFRSAVTTERIYRTLLDYVPA